MPGGLMNGMNVMIKDVFGPIARIALECGQIRRDAMISADKHLEESIRMLALRRQRRIARGKRTDDLDTQLMALRRAQRS